MKQERIDDDVITLATLEQYFVNSEDESRIQRRKSEKCRDYYDNVQMTATELKILNSRKQPPVVLNKIAQKVDFLLGTERNARTDPKAFPRTPDSDEAADAVTDAIRYALDINDFDVLASEVFENEVVEGSGGASVEVELKGDDIQIVINRIRWDRFFADPYALRRDFKDARYTGVITWMDMVDIRAKWPDNADDIQEGMNQSAASETYDDKPIRWFNKGRQRAMIIDMYYLWKGEWHHVIYAKGVILDKPKPSAYLDEDGLPENPHILQSAKVKRDGQRYGPVEAMIDPQDEINKRRSKALHLLTTRQTFSKEGRVENITEFKKEVNKPDGHVEFPNQGEYGKDFGVLPNEGLVAAQFQMGEQAMSFLDTVQANAALEGKTQGSLSGRAIQSLQQGGMVELTPLFDGHAQWKKRIYRAVWNRIKQFWTDEKWVRVTDDEDNLKFVGLNQPITVAEKRLVEETGLSPTEVRNQFAQDLQRLYAIQPEMQAIDSTENDVTEMDVDIIIEEVPDVVNLQSEQFDQLVAMYQANPNGIPWESVVEMSTLRNKDKILNKDQTPEEQQAAAQAQEIAQEAMQIQKDGAVADIQTKRAKMAKDLADAEGQKITNQLLLQGKVEATSRANS